MARRMPRSPPRSMMPAGPSGSCRSSDTASRPTVIDGLAGAIDWFFALPIDEKRRSMSPRPSINRGYTPPRSERLSYSLGVVSPDDLFEAFNVGAAVSDFPHLSLDPEIYAENIWPDGPGGVAYRDGVLTWMAERGSRGANDDVDLRRGARPSTRALRAVHRPFDRRAADEPLRRPRRGRGRPEPDGDGCPHRLRDRHGPVGRSGARPRDPAGRRQLAPHHAGARGAADQPRRSDRPLVERSLALHDAPCRSTPRRRGNADPPAVGGVLPRWQRGRRDLDARTVSRRGRVEQLRRRHRRRAPRPEVERITRPGVERARRARRRRGSATTSGHRRPDDRPAPRRSVRFVDARHAAHSAHVSPAGFVPAATSGAVAAVANCVR